MEHSVRVFAPATLSNIGSGFDLLGLAVYGPGDEVEIFPNHSNELRIVSISGDEGKLSYEIEKNTCTVAMQAFLESFESVQGFDVIIDKKMPLGSGLGSSAASACAGVFALNEYFDKPYSRNELMHFALKGEFIASQGFHADNIAPCLLGGFTFIYNNDPLSVRQLQYPDQLHLVIAYQQVQILTAEARALLPKHYERSTVVKQQGLFGSLLIGLFHKDYELIAQGIQDHVAVPYRKGLIPNYSQLEELALQNSAIGFSISGSGPTVFGLCRDEQSAVRVMEAWEKYLIEQPLPYICFASPINKEGALRIS
jgi:homoserine kinase